MRRAILLLVVVTAFSLVAAANTGISVVAPPGNAVLNSYDTSTSLGAAGTPWTINETVTGSPVYLVFSNPTGAPALGPGNPTGSGHEYGRWIAKTVTNGTAVAWTSFEMEVQSIFGVPSTDGDGLSFAQGAGFTFTSDAFAIFTHEDIARDYINFSQGIVNPGDSVTFWFAITDNQDRATFWLKETPNKRDVPVGVPEPASLVLFGTGVLALARKLRKA